MTSTIVDSSAPILSVICKEPEGDIKRDIRFMPLSIENLRQMWEKSRQFTTLFTSEINNDFRKFVEMFVREGANGLEVNGLFWVVDDFVGVLYMTQIEAGIDALVHYSFFDRRHKGREILVKAMIRYVFEHYGFRRLTVEVPMYVTHNTFEFVESVGFKAEGRKRKCAEYKGDWFDIRLFGILREEALTDGDQV